MTLKRYAIINTQTNVIENVIEFDSEPNAPVPGFEDYYIAIQNDYVGTNWNYVNGELIAPIIQPFSTE